MNQLRGALENPDAYQAYIERGGPDPEVMQKFHRLSGLVFHPRTLYQPGSHEAIDRHLDAGKPAVFSFSHASWADIPVIGAVLQHDEIYDKSIGTIAIPAKATLFKYERFAKLLKSMGAIETQRQKDIKDDSLEDRRIAAAKQIIITCQTFLSKGGLVGTAPEDSKHIAGFWEGTRNRGDRTQVQPIKSGIIRIMDGAPNRDDLMVIFMSPYYGNHEHFKNVLRPTVGIGHLALSENPRITKSTIREAQQKTLDLAVATYHGR